ncbi:hypothetical protein ACETU7_02985 [Rhodococcus sp. 3Y1]
MARGVVEVLLLGQAHDAVDRAGASARFSSIPIGPAVVVSATLTVPSVDTPVEFGGLTVLLHPPRSVRAVDGRRGQVGTGGSASNCDMSSGGMAAVVVFALEVLDAESSYRNHWNNQPEAAPRRLRRQ